MVKAKAFRGIKNGKKATRKTKKTPEQVRDAAFVRYGQSMNPTTVKMYCKAIQKVRDSIAKNLFTENHSSCGTEHKIFHGIDSTLYMIQQAHIDRLNLVFAETMAFEPPPIEDDSHGK